MAQGRPGITAAALVDVVGSSLIGLPVSLNGRLLARLFCAIRSYLATATRHGIGWLDALIQAAQGNPGSPARHKPRPR